MQQVGVRYIYIRKNVVQGLDERTALHQSCFTPPRPVDTQLLLTLSRKPVNSPDLADHRAAKTIAAATVFRSAVGTLGGRTHAQPLVRLWNQHIKGVAIPGGVAVDTT